MVPPRRLHEHSAKHQQEKAKENTDLGATEHFLVLGT